MLASVLGTASASLVVTHSDFPSCSAVALSNGEDSEPRKTERQNWRARYPSGDLMSRGRESYPPQQVVQGNEGWRGEGTGGYCLGASHTRPRSTMRSSDRGSLTSHPSCWCLRPVPESV